MDLTVIQTAFNNVIRLYNELRQRGIDYYDPKSLPEITKLTHVEPLTILSSSLLNQENLKDINLVLLNLFCGYYVHGIDILTKVKDVEVIRILDKLNPDRDSTALLLMAGNESASIPSEYKHNLLASEIASFGFEDANSDRDQIKIMNEISSASVGRQIQVTINYNQVDKEGNKSDEDKCITLPINVRLLTMPMPSNSFVKWLTSRTDEFTLTERYHDWRSGKISGFKDLMLCRDVIREHRKLLMEDKSGVVQEVLRRATASKKYGMLTKNPTLMSSSSIYVMSEQDAKEIEYKMGGKISNPNVRNKIFDNGYAMIMTIVNRETEMVTFYSDGISAGTTLTFKEIINKAKGQGPDIAEIFKSFQVNAPTVF